MLYSKVSGVVTSPKIVVNLSRTISVQRFVRFFISHIPTDIDKHPVTFMILKLVKYEGICLFRAKAIISCKLLTC